MGPGFVATAFSGREPFASVGKGLELITYAGEALSMADANRGCGLGELPRVPWSSAGSSAGFNAPGEAGVSMALCWFVDRLKPVLDWTRVASVAVIAVALFLYLRRRLDAFGQAGGE